MFLNQLTIPEKEMFVSLAVKAAETNGIVTEEEYDALEEYCKEMGISFFDARGVKSIDEIVLFFEKAELIHKKIVLLEIIALLYSDGEYDSKEKGFVEEFADKTGLSKDDVETQEKMVIKYISLLNEMKQNLA